MGRHLLTTLTSSSSSPTNATSDLPCTDFCDPSCGDFDECYTFPAIPDEPLPPSPFPLPPPIVATPSSSSDDSFHFSPLVIVVIVVLATAFLLISYYAVIIKYCSFLTRLFTRRDLARMPHSPSAGGGGGGGGGGVHSSPNNNHFVDHPIWLISTVGLHQSIINSITVIRYKKEDGLIDGTDCSVCLSEFQQGETLRLLPKCKHAFHIDCIDTWLRSHTNCPMCRAGIVAHSGRRPSMAANEPSFGHSRRSELTLMPDSDSSDVELGNTHPGISNSSSSNDNNNNNNSNGNLVVRENRGAETRDVEGANNNNNHLHQNKPDDYIALLIRRSYSMDYQNAGVQVQPNNSNSSSFALMAGSSSRSLPPRVAFLKRSYSWSERVFCQNDRNSVMSP